jgi:hypothetical protein
MVASTAVSLVVASVAVVSMAAVVVTAGIADALLAFHSAYARVSGGSADRAQLQRV